MRRESIDYIVQNDDVGDSLKEILQDKMKLSSRLIRNCKREKLIYCNKKRPFMNYMVQVGDVISVILPFEHNQFIAEDIPLHILYEDKDIMAVDKPPYMVVHPTKGCTNGTLANAISYYFNKSNYTMKIRFINRIDRDTSGIVLIAKNSYAQNHLLEQMKRKSVDKIYYALVSGELQDDQGVIDAPIGKKNDGDIYREVFQGGKPSITHYKVIERYGHRATLLQLRLETGRTHQIRVHLKSIGHPIIGDGLYGGDTRYTDRQMLHCVKMDFLLPDNNEMIEINSKLPKDINEVINMFKKELFMV